MRFTTTATAVCAALPPLAVAQSPYQGYAEQATKTLLQWYNSTTGIFDTTGWWNSANAITALVDLASVDNTVRSEVDPILPNTFVAAQKYNLDMSKTVSANGLIRSSYGQRWSQFAQGIAISPSTKPTGFLNGFYDDEGWWALAWIGAYDLTKNDEYLSTAQSIFDDMSKAWDTPCGGIWWDRNRTYVNAIANELFLSVGSHLANRVGSSQKQYYLDWAHKEWDWFKASGLINADNNINDGLDLATCKNNGKTVWTYNQGVVLGGLVELNRAAPDSSYLPTATTLAKAAIANLTDAGSILHDTCEPDCGPDGGQFKGVFMRNLQLLQGVAPDSEYKNFFAKNADSIWAKDRDAASNELSVVWSGPFVSPGNASVQTSALDALVAAAATS